MEKNNLTMSEKKLNTSEKHLTNKSPPIISYGNSKKRILGCIKKNLNLTRTAKFLNMSKSNVTQHLQALAKKDIVYKKDYSWKLTETGEKLVSDEFSSIVMSEARADVTTSWIQDRAHNIKVKIKIVSQANNPMSIYGWDKSDTKMKNQTWYARRFDGLLVKHTGKNIIIQLPIIRAKDSELANAEAIRIVNYLMNKIENSAKGLKLGTFEIFPQIFTQHHAIPQEPISKIAKKLNLSYRDDKIDVDASDTPELEFTDSKTSEQDFMRYLKYVKDFSINEVLTPSEIQKSIFETQQQLNALTKLTQVTNLQLQTFIKTITPQENIIDKDYDQLRKWT